MFKGIKETIGDETIIIPALSLGQLRNGIIEKLAEHDKLMKEGKIFEAVVIRGEVIFEAIKRNYPDFSEIKLMDFLDLRNSDPIWLIVLGNSGLKPGEEAAAAETTKITGT